MTIWTCDKQDDSHADYPHRLVMPATGKPIRLVFVICAHCSHWSQCTTPKCKCRYRCHDRAREGNPAGTLAFTAERVYAGLSSSTKMEARQDDDQDRTEAAH